MQQLGCELHSVTCVSCYVHVCGNKVIIIIPLEYVKLSRRDAWKAMSVGGYMHSDKSDQNHISIRQPQTHRM